MRVLVTCKGGSDGHLDPLLPVARALRDRGEEVRFASDESRGARLAEEGFGLEVAGLTLSEQMRRGMPVVEAAGAVRGDLDFTYTRLFPTVAAPPMLDDLLSLGQRWRPDLVVHEIAEFAGPPLAASLGVPWLTVGLGLPMSEDLADRAGHSAAQLWEGVGLEAMRYGGLYRYAFLDPSPRSLAPAWELSSTSARISFRTGEPLIPPPPIAPEIAAHLDRHAGRPAVHVTLGTAGFNRRTDVFQTMIGALSLLEAVGIITVGVSNDPTDLGPLPESVLAVRYAPIAGLLPRCAAVVSHAGAGTTFATLGHGLPTVLVPLGADQPRIASAVASTGAARVLDAADLNAATVNEALQWALHDQDARHAAQTLASEITATPPAAIALERALVVAGWE